MKEITVWSVGENMPGYMCDSEPSLFPLDEEALADECLKELEDAEAEHEEEFGEPSNYVQWKDITSIPVEDWNQYCEEVNRPEWKVDEE